jgi:hypothetical protein
MILVLTLLRLQNLGSQIFLEDAPLALGPNFGLSVEFWIRLPLLKTQAHVVIALGTPRGTITKTPPTQSNHNSESESCKSACLGTLILYMCYY